MLAASAAVATVTADDTATARAEDGMMPPHVAGPAQGPAAVVITLQNAGGDTIMLGEEVGLEAGDEVGST